MLYTVEEISKRIMPVAMKYQLPAVYLFGSYAKGTATETRDIDLTTVSSLEQEAQMPSQQDFRNAVWRERVKLYAVA